MEGEKGEGGGAKGGGHHGNVRALLCLRTVEEESDRRFIGLG